MDDPYRRISKREVYRNPWLAVEAHDIVHPTGVQGEHVLVCGGRASGVLVLQDQTFIFARQPRFGARAMVLEIVKGGADDGETPLACAKRELREELGLQAASWMPLGTTLEIPSIMDTPVELFLATELSGVETDLENVEEITAVRMPVEEAYRAAIDGRIDDAVTLAALLRYKLVNERSPSKGSP